MAQQGDGWPMGLQPVSRIRVGFSRNPDVSSASASFSALLTSSPTSSDSSSDLDTESTGSFFHDRSITLGRLIGASSVLNLSRRSTRVRNRKLAGMDTEKHGKPRTRPCLLSLCLGRDSVNVEENRNIGIAAAALSLGHFLAIERKAAAPRDGRSVLPPAYSPDEMSIVQAAGQSSNSLFVDGRIAPPLRSPGKTQVNTGISASFCCVCTR
ncbi:hypothetical protein MLD38_040119 [Melastoma candidum]|uniref:Uncharacterized protein n=1 Tax=Melastoma candidum TaxID=119954 RepID=A0ACB9L4D7_9MYRT|nr:hypothetical protein MLD38_040119 [Melastoma candidum]